MEELFPRTVPLGWLAPQSSGGSSDFGHCGVTSKTICGLPLIMDGFGLREEAECTSATLASQRLPHGCGHTKKMLENGVNRTNPSTLSLGHIIKRDLTACNMGPRNLEIALSERSNLRSLSRWTSSKMKVESRANWTRRSTSKAVFS
ncbi:hypothetical protein PoB_004015000 [Plakobranchus ocellatus]|uniref:Uncharacterized protein n=1 Tax=Plakobranchus ocellatus TaxID=259542 RepID=A0AAV4AZ50_9GAST|nr:hypothetical protein PoB_004015000 [Plakobranchus ocellatus]